MFAACIIFNVYLFFRLLGEIFESPSKPNLLVELLLNTHCV